MISRLKKLPRWLVTILIAAGVWLVVFAVYQIDRLIQPRVEVFWSKPLVISSIAPSINGNGVVVIPYHGYTLVEINHFGAERLLLNYDIHNLPLNYVAASDQNYLLAQTRIKFPGYMQILDAAGHEVSQHAIPENLVIQGLQQIANGQVLINHDAGVCMLDRELGEVWSFGTEDKVENRPVVTESGRVFFPVRSEFGKSNLLYCLNPDGSLAWIYDTVVMARPPLQPIMDAGLVVGTNLGLLLIDRDGARQWHKYYGKQVRLGPLIWEGVIYCGTDDKAFHALDLMGNELWQASISSRQSGFFLDGVDAAFLADGRLALLMTKIRDEGSFLDVLHSFASAPVLSGELLILDPATGGIEGSYHLPLVPQQFVLSGDGDVFVMDQEQSLHALSIPE